MSISPKCLVSLYFLNDDYEGIQTSASCPRISQRKASPLATTEETGERKRLLLVKNILGRLQRSKPEALEEFKAEGATFTFGLARREVRGGELSFVDAATFCFTRDEKGVMFFLTTADLAEYQRKCGANDTIFEKRRKLGESDAEILRRTPYSAVELYFSPSAAIRRDETLFQRLIAEKRQQLLDELGILPLKPVLIPLEDGRNPGYVPCLIVNFGGEHEQ